MSGSLRLAMLALSAAGILPGCAAWRGRLPTADVAQQRQVREADAVKLFEAHRDEAQLQAALDRWAQGDPAGCETRLRALVNRHPGDNQVRLHLAELLWSQGAAREAESELQQVLAAEPASGAAHHLMGMVLAENGRQDEARGHLALATSLDPENAVFRQTLESLSGSGSRAAESQKSWSLDPGPRGTGR